MNCQNYIKFLTIFVFIIIYGMDREELLKLIETKKIVGIDLSGEKLEKILVSAR